MLHMEFYSSYILPAEEKKLTFVQKESLPCAVVVSWHRGAIIILGRLVFICRFLRENGDSWCRHPRPWSWPPL